MKCYWEIVPGTRCNLKCRTCYAADNARPDLRQLSWKLMKSALDNAVELGVKEIDILGGEPLLYPHLDKFVNHFKKRVPDGFCGIVSNGVLLTRDRAKTLHDSGLSQITISLDGTSPQINDANRGNGSFQTALAGIENARTTGIPLTISYTVTPFNITDTSNLLPFIEQIGAHALGIQITEMVGRAKKTLVNYSLFNRLEGLKAICRVYQTRPSFQVEVLTQSLFKDFLNHFFNAGLGFPVIRCNGGQKSFMVSSGGDLFPCSQYAYSPEGETVNLGINLATGDLKSIKEFVAKHYRRFNNEMVELETNQFTTCQKCEYRAICAPCPLVNPRGVVPECEWVKTQTKVLNKQILDSKAGLLTEPVAVDDDKISFNVSTQSEPIVVPMSKKEFMSLMTLPTVAKIVQRIQSSGNDKNAKKLTIEFLCKLRSHQVIKIAAIDTFLS